MSTSVLPSDRRHSNSHLDDSFAQHRSKKAKSNLQSWEEKKRLHKLKKKEKKERRERKQLKKLAKLAGQLGQPAPSVPNGLQAFRGFSSDGHGTSSEREHSDAREGLSPAVTGLDAGVEDPLARLEVTRASVVLTSQSTPSSSRTPPRRPAPVSADPIVIDDEDDDAVEAITQPAAQPRSILDLSLDPDSPIRVADPDSVVFTSRRRRERRRELPIPVSNATEPIVIEDDPPEPPDLDLAVLPPVRRVVPPPRQRSKASERFCELVYYGPQRETLWESHRTPWGIENVMLEPSERSRALKVASGKARAGKGFGLRATSDIKNGQTIVHESPLLVVTDSDISGVPELFDALSDEERRICLSFPWTTESEDPFVGMISTNFIPHTGPNGEDQSAIFEYISRTNHSCRPNSHWYWDSEAQERYLMALRDISAGEEITASYVDEFDLLKSRFKRRQILKGLHEFTCLCPGCDQDTAGVKASDKNRKRIMDSLVRWEAVRSTRGIAALASEPEIVSEISDVVRLLRIEGVEIHLDYPIEILFQIHAAHGRKELARDTAKVLVRTLRRKAGRRDATWEEMKWYRDPESWHGYGTLVERTESVKVEVS